MHKIAGYHDSLTSMESSSIYSFSSEELDIDSATDDAASVASSVQPAPGIRRHTKYYFDEANVQLLVSGHILSERSSTLIVYVN